MSRYFRGFLFVGIMTLSVVTGCQTNQQSGSVGGESSKSGSGLGGWFVRMMDANQSAPSTTGSPAPSASASASNTPSPSPSPTPCPNSCDNGTAHACCTPGFNHCVTGSKDGKPLAWCATDKKSCPIPPNGSWCGSDTGDSACCKVGDTCKTLWGYAWCDQTKGCKGEVCGTKCCTGSDQCCDAVGRCPPEDSRGRGCSKQQCTGPGETLCTGNFNVCCPAGTQCVPGVGGASPNCPPATPTPTPSPTPAPSTSPSSSPSSSPSQNSGIQTDQSIKHSTQHSTKAMSSGQEPSEVDGAEKPVTNESSPPPVQGFSPDFSPPLPENANDPAPRPQFHPAPTQSRERK